MSVAVGSTSRRPQHVRPRIAFSAIVLVTLAAVLVTACTSRRPAPVFVRTTPAPSDVSQRESAPPIPVLKPRQNREVASATRSETRAGSTRDKSMAKAQVAPKAVRVARGDTVYAISRRHDVPVRNIIVLNRLKPPYKLFVGQVLKLPHSRLHTVKRGDTVYGVSRRYGVDMSALVRANKIPPPYRLEVGQKLHLPSSTQFAQAERAVASKAATKADVRAARAAPSSARKNMPSKPPPRAGKRFSWPVKGTVVSSFGPKKGGLHNDGINISAPPGSPVRAAENGVVAYAGNELRGFGNLILLRHADGWISAYGHNETLLVERGDVVKRGQVIARSGRSGNVSAPQAHFELRKKGKPVDPTKYLARG